MDSIRAAQILGITSSTFLAGSNALYTYNLIPTLLSQLPSNQPSKSAQNNNPANPDQEEDPKATKEEEKRLISQWRHMFLIGFRATQAQCLIILPTFLFLSYKTRQPSSPFLDNTTSYLYLAAGLISTSIIPYTLTIQRALNGALVMRAEDLAGQGFGTPAERAGKGEKRTLEFERGRGTAELVGLWGRYNGVRALIGLVGSVVGIWASLEHASRVGRGRR